MTQRWSVGKPQVVRPFPEAKDALKSMTFRLGPDRPFEARDAYEAREVNVAALEPEFRFGDLPRDNADGLSVVISLQDGSLHRREIVHESCLADVPETVGLDRDIVRRFGWKQGVRAVVSIIKANDESKPKQGGPWMRGHWIARRVLTIGSKPKARSFPIESWPDEEFRRRSVAPGAVSWLDLTTDDLNQRFKDPNDVFRLGIRTDVYDALAANQEGAGPKAAFALIVCETLTEIVYVGLSHLGDDELERGGLLDNLVRRVTRQTGVQFPEIRRLAGQDDGRARIRALVQTMHNTAQPLVRLRRSG